MVVVLKVERLVWWRMSVLGEGVRWNTHIDELRRRVAVGHGLRHDRDFVVVCVFV